MHISLTNIDNKHRQDVEIDLQGFKAKHVSGRILTSLQVQDHNTFDDPRNVTPKNFNQAQLLGNKLMLTMPPISLIVLELKQ